MNEHYLVIGGTGKTGRRVVEKLQEKGHTVRIGSRNASPAFDWHNPEGWNAALESIKQVYITYQPDLAVPGALEAIQKLVTVAKEQQVEHLVLLSGKGEREAELSEQAVANSGIDYTLVRASWFNQNFSESFFLEPIQSGVVALPHPQAKVPYVDANDIADVVVAALTDQKHRGKLYEVTGPEPLTFGEVIDIINLVTGKSIDFIPISQEAYDLAMEEQGIPADFRWLMNYLFTEVLNAPHNHEVSHDVEKVLGRPATPFISFAKQVAATGIWG